MEHVANSAVEVTEDKADHAASSLKEGRTRAKGQRHKRHEPALPFEEIKFEDDEDFTGTLLAEEKWKIRRSAARTSHGGGSQQGYYYSENPLNKYTRAPHSTLASSANRRVSCHLP